MVSRVRKIHRSADRSIKRNAHDVASCACVSAALARFFRCERMAAVLSFSTRVEGKKPFVLSAPRNYPGAVSVQIARYFTFFFALSRVCFGAWKEIVVVTNRCVPCASFRARIYIRLRLMRKSSWERETAHVEARSKRCKICHCS